MGLNLLKKNFINIILCGSGLRHASEVAILNANYMLKRLEGYYKSKYVNDNGFCAHEFIIDCQEFKSCGIEVIDISKRLMDYGMKKYC